MENNPAEAKKRSSRRILIIAVVVIVFVLAAIAVGRLWYDSAHPEDTVKDESVNIRVAPATVDNVEISSVYTGKLTAVNEVNVIPKIPGKVTSVEVSQGDAVVAGAVLFRLDPEDVQRQVNQAQIQHDAAKSALDLASDAVRTAESMVAAAKTPPAASSVPDMSGGASLPDVADLAEAAEAAAVAQATAQAQATAAQAQAIAQTEAALAQAKAGYEQANVQFKLAREGLAAANAALSECTVTAPIDGYVTALNVQRGGMASQAMPSVSISDTNALRITTNVSEGMVDAVRIGDSAEVYVRAISDTPFTGTITAVVPAPPAGSLSYPVVIELPSGDSRLKPGMFAEIRMTTGRAADVVAIPSEAVLIKAGAEVVMVIDADERVRSVRVETGLDDGALVEIRSGLKSGDKVVFEGQHYLNEDSEFKIVE
ncbi:MAG: efflux RND transporter periplasmic adaptor subunit [Clostridiales Family XIII bacterium]|jgi:RND family efflux transporter MFP subunit|nr:efflux RND transporter periplasmic adaptor subunit [Clostridiales Family XIII bacterium]